MKNIPDFLKGVKYTKGPHNCLEYDIHKLNSKKFGWYANRVFNFRRKGRLIDVGDKMMISFNTRKGFSNEEKTIVNNFFWDDYSRSFECSQDCLMTFEEGQGEKKTAKYSYLAAVLARRAKESLDSERILFNLLDYKDNDQFSYSDCFDDLKRYRTRVHLAIEFPKNYFRLTELVTRKDRAVELEDYTLASDISDEIDEFTKL